MAQSTLDNGEARVLHRTKINDNFTEVYGNIDAQTIVSVTGAVTLDATAFGKIHVCTGTSADYNLTLLTAVGHTGKCIAIKGAAALTKVVTVVCNGAQTIDSYTTRKIAQHGLFVVMSDGTNWVMVNEVGSFVAFTPVYTGFSADPTTDAKYFRIGKNVNIRVAPSAGTSNATTFTMTLPFNSKFTMQYPILAFNSGATVSGRMNLTAASTLATLYATGAGGAWTNSGTKNCPLDFWYEIE